MRYHHFGGKDALLRAVYEAVQAHTDAKVVSAALAVPEPLGGGERWPVLVPGP